MDWCQIIGSFLLMEFTITANNEQFIVIVGARDVVPGV